MPNKQETLTCLVLILLSCHLSTREGFAQQQLTVIENAKIVLVNEAEVAAKDAGIAETVSIKTGDEVQRGDTIIGLDSESYQIEFEIAEVDLKIAEQEKSNRTGLQYALKTKQVAEKIVQRLREATSKMEDVVSKTELEQRQLELEQAIAAVDQAKHDIEIASLTASLKKKQRDLARLRLANRTIRSPLSGRVAKVLVQPGEHVAAGQTIARVIDLNTLKIQASIPIEFYPDLKLGQPVKFTTRLGNQTVTTAATISYIASEIDVTNQDFLIWAEFKNLEQKMFPGLAGDLTVFKN